jgi:hypothetical protein
VKTKEGRGREESSARRNRAITIKTSDLIEGAIMEMVWAVIVSVILILIIYGIISSKIQKRRPASISIGNVTLKKIDQVFDPEKRYNVAINSGAKFERVKIIGFAEAIGGPNDEIMWSSRRWLILEGVDGARVFVSPYRVMWMKEAGSQ